MATSCAASNDQGQVAGKRNPDATGRQQQQAAVRQLAGAQDALMHAVMDALEAHSTMSTQALGAERVREGLKNILLGPAQLYEALRAKAQNGASMP